MPLGYNEAMRRFQFSIRTLVILTVFVACACALCVAAVKCEHALWLRKAAQEEESQKALMEYFKQLIKRPSHTPLESP